MGHPPVVQRDSGGVPRTLVTTGSAPAGTVSTSGYGRPITLTSNAPPIMLFDEAGNPYDIITSIFADGTDGFYFDFSKTDRLFQTTTGGALADDAGENIAFGLESHAWSGGTLAQAVGASAELLGTGATGVAGAPTPATYSASTGVGVVDKITFTDQSFVRFTVTSGLVYRLDLQNTDATKTLAIRPNLGSAYTTLGPGARSVFYVKATNANFDICNANTDGQVGFIVRSLKLIAGNHGLQATAAAQPKYQTGGLARFDGTDDNLLTTLVPGTATSLLFDVNVPATLAATQVICGGTVGTSRCLLGINTSGQVCAGVGTDGTTTILGSTDLRGTRAKVGLVFNGTTVNLYEAGASVYSAAQNGSPGSDALRLGASNNAGTAGSFWAGDDYKGLAIKKALTAAQIAAITNKWGTS